MKIAHFDIETTTWFDMAEIKKLPRDLQVAAMKFGCGVIVFRDKPYEYLDTLVPGAKDAPRPSVENMWQDLQEIPDAVSGWNITSFDLPIICREAGGTMYHFEPEVIDLFDIIRRITGRWYKLDTIAKANLDQGKIGDGGDAAVRLRKGGKDNIEFALEYCLSDVHLSKAITEIALKGDGIFLPGLKKPGQGEDLMLRLDWGHGEYELRGVF